MTTVLMIEPSNSMSDLFQNLALVAHIFLEEVPHGRTSTSQLLHFTRQILHNQIEQCTTLEQILTQHSKGEIKIGGKWFFISNNEIYGLCPKLVPCEIHFVNTNNIDTIFRLHANNINPQLQMTYNHLVQLQHTVQMLQSNLAQLTFRIMCADNERYKKIQLQRQNVDRMRRLVRRQERAAYIEKKIHTHARTTKYKEKRKTRATNEKKEINHTKKIHTLKRSGFFCF